MKITRVSGREIFDSRGFPTIECEIVLEEGFVVTGSSPNSIYTDYQARALYDQDARIFGKSVAKSIENLETIIAPQLIGKEPSVVELDLLMLELDGTPDKSRLGANTIFSASSAILKAQAIVEELEPFELVAHLCDQSSVSIPFPLFTLIDGGICADTYLPLQEIMIVPKGAGSFRESMELGVVIYHTLRSLLAKKDFRIALGEYGGMTPDISDVNQILDLVMESIELNNANDTVALALNIGASYLYDIKTQIYSWQDKRYNVDGMIKWYEKIIQSYPIYSLQDGISNRDIEGWKILTQTLGEVTHIVGGDVFATSPERIIDGIEKQLVNAVALQPYQIGTITEALQAVTLCKDNELLTMLEAAIGETNDTLIVDIAVGVSAGHIKAGAPCRGERVAKYNQLLRIEDSLMFSLLTS